MTMSFNGSVSKASVLLGQINVPSGTGAFTMCAFFKRKGSTQDGLILSKALSTWSMGVNNTGFAFFNMSTAGSIKNINGVTSVDDETSHWIACRYDGSQMGIWLVQLESEDAELFLDASDTKNGDVDVNTNAVEIGYDSLELRPAWDGSIADVRIYTRALSINEMTTIAFLGGQDGIVSGLEFWWPLNDGVEGEEATGIGTVKDHSDNKVNGFPTRERSSPGPFWEDGFPYLGQKIF